MFQQHVALGDSIVRDVPEVELVRAGIRHHHERWDGNGYLDHLEGEAIPLIGRILAVADAYTAMTTTRPYRKALRSRRRSSGWATLPQPARGELVKAFITGIETDSTPPCPARSRLAWLPRRRLTDASAGAVAVAVWRLSHPAAVMAARRGRRAGAKRLVAGVPTTVTLVTNTGMAADEIRACA